MVVCPVPIINVDYDLPKYRRVGLASKPKAVEEKVTCMLVKKVELSDGLIAIGLE